MTQILLPINAQSSQKQPDKFNEKLLAKAQLDKYLKENALQNMTNNTPSNIFQNLSLFQSYYYKYQLSRRQFLQELYISGLNMGQSPSTQVPIQMLYY